jgi:hypothetical protein
MIQWIGNILIVIGLWKLGSQKRNAFWFLIAGNVPWLYYGFTHSMWGLVFIYCVFTFTSVRSLVLWKKPE